MCFLGVLYVKIQIELVCFFSPEKSWIPVSPPQRWFCSLTYTPGLPPRDYVICCRSARTYFDDGSTRRWFPVLLPPPVTAAISVSCRFRRCAPACRSTFRWQDGCVLRRPFCSHSLICAPVGTAYQQISCYVPVHWVKESILVTKCLSPYEGTWACVPVWGHLCFLLWELPCPCALPLFPGADCLCLLVGRPLDTMQKIAFYVMWAVRFWFVFSLWFCLKGF